MRKRTCLLRVMSGQRDRSMVVPCILHFYQLQIFEDGIANVVMEYRCSVRCGTLALVAQRCYAKPPQPVREDCHLFAQEVWQPDEVSADKNIAHRRTWRVTK